MGPALCLIFATTSFGQGLGNTRLGMNQLVRQMMPELSQTYVHDTTLDRFLNYAHRETKMALRELTDIDTQVVITTVNRIKYDLNADAMRGRISTVLFRANDAVGGGEELLRFVPPQLIGQTGEPSPGRSYTVIGNDLFLSESPTGGDTIIVWYSDVSDDLAADGDALEVAEEDEIAIAHLSMVYLYLRDGKSAEAQMLYGFWKDHIAMRTGVQR